MNERAQCEPEAEAADRAGDLTELERDRGERGADDRGAAQVSHRPDDMR